MSEEQRWPKGMQQYPSVEAEALEAEPASKEEPASEQQEDEAESKIQIIPTVIVLALFLLTYRSCNVQPSAKTFDEMVRDRANSAVNSTVEQCIIEQGRPDLIDDWRKLRDSTEAE